jgi:hypothetical protein
MINYWTPSLYAIWVVDSEYLDLLRYLYFGGWALLLVQSIVNSNTSSVCLLVGSSSL